MHIKSTVVGFKHIYTEPFKKDGSLATWQIRRDAGLGTSSGKVYFTTDNRIILR